MSGRAAPTCRASRRLALGALLAVAIAGCGGGSHHSDHHGADSTGNTNTVDIYSSLPESGPTAADSTAIVQGIELSLARADHQAGQFTIHYIQKDDATPSSHGWDPATVEANARAAANDLKAVLYIGDESSEADELSIPILNEAGIAQISPTVTYDGLTSDNEPGFSAQLEPEKYYPNDELPHTFFRLVPRASMQASADLAAIHQARCNRVAIGYDERSDDPALGQLMEREAAVAGVDVVTDHAVTPRNVQLDMDLLRTHPIDCYEYIGTPRHGGVAITEAVHGAFPAATIFGPSSMCTPAWTNPAKGGVPAAVDHVLRCTSPILGMTAGYNNALTDAFIAAFQDRYAVINPNPLALYGYEAMQLAIDTITDLGSKGDDRAAVVAALAAVHDRASVLSPTPTATYSFDPDGDTTLSDYGLYDVGSDHDPLYERTVYARPGT
jgi:branched-chain amino acid transport system substrate-binding protein